MNRLFSLESHVDAQALRTGNLKDTEWEKLIEGAGRIGKSRMIIDDTSGISIAEMRSKCRKYKLELGLGLNHHRLPAVDERKRRTEQRKPSAGEISEISRSLKGLARELNVPVIALSSCSRAVESRTDKRPMLSDLRESERIEQDADVCMFIYREDYYIPDTEDKNIAEYHKLPSRETVRSERYALHGCRSTRDSETRNTQKRIKTEKRNCKRTRVMLPYISDITRV